MLKLNTRGVKQKDVKHLAKLSALDVTPEEIDLYTKQFEETLRYVENMRELNTRGVEHISGLKNVYFKDGTKCDRQFTAEEATKNSKKHKDGYFIVDRIL